MLVAVGDVEEGERISAWRSFKLSDHVIAPDYLVSDIIKLSPKSHFFQSLVWLERMQWSFLAQRIDMAARHLSQLDLLGRDEGNQTGLVEIDTDRH